MHAGMCRDEAAKMWLTPILLLPSAHQGGKKTLFGSYFAWEHMEACQLVGDIMYPYVIMLMDSGN